MRTKPSVADFSQEVLTAFRRRSKAISHKGATLHAIPVKEIVDGRESKLSRSDVELIYRIDSARVMLRIHTWADRWVWVDARRSSKSGWVWESTSEGRFSSPGGARDLVAYAEATLSAAHLSATDAPQAISAIWSKCLTSKLAPGLLS